MEVDRNFIKLYDVDKLGLGLDYTLKSSGPVLWTSCLAFLFANIKRRMSGKCKQAPLLLTPLRSGRRINDRHCRFLEGDVSFAWTVSKSLCSIVSKLSRGGCCLFVLQPKCFPHCQADRQQKPACLKHEIVASARTPKSPWRFWKRVRGKCTGSRKWLSQGHQWPIALDGCDMPGHFLRHQWAKWEKIFLRPCCQQTLFSQSILA